MVIIRKNSFKIQILLDSLHLLMSFGFEYNQKKRFAIRQSSFFFAFLLMVRGRLDIDPRQSELKRKKKEIDVLPFFVLQSRRIQTNSVRPNQSERCHSCVYLPHRQIIYVLVHRRVQQQWYTSGYAVSVSIYIQPKKMRIQTRD